MRLRLHCIQRRCRIVAIRYSIQVLYDRNSHATGILSPYLHRLLRATPLTPLQCLGFSVVRCRLPDIFKVVHMHSLLPPLEHVIPRPFSQT
jgi:hypothetical protein